MRNMALGLGLAVIFGCDHEHEVEYVETRLVPAEQRCPSAASVRAEEHVDEAEFARAYGLRQRLVCWYRVEVRGKYPVCTSGGPTLDELRSYTASDLPRPIDLGDLVDTTLDCADDGPVLRLLTNDETCSDALDGRWVEDFDNGRTGAGPRLVMRELLAVDVRPSLVMCEYDLTDERTQRACNGTSSYGGI